MATTSLSDEEQQVVYLKYASKQVGSMSQDEISKWSKALLLKIHVITGWTIPGATELMNILIDQFSKYIVEKFPSLNPEEIEYAFRNHGHNIEDWGKAMNLQLIDKVLTPYLSNRLRISEMERQIAYYRRRPEFNFREDINWPALIDEDYQRFCFNPNFKFLPPPHYYQVLEEAEYFFPKNWYKERLSMYKKKWPDVEISKLFELSRARCVIQLFRTLRRYKVQSFI